MVVVHGGADVRSGERPVQQAESASELTEHAQLVLTKMQNRGEMVPKYVFAKALRKNEP